MSKEIILNNGNKIFEINNNKIYALKDVSVTFSSGKFYAIMGHSGAGKSTLIQILGLLDTLSNGYLYINGKTVSSLSEDEKAYIRMKHIGFVFQSFYLNNRLTASENVILPMYINSQILRTERKNRAYKLLEQFGLHNRINHYPRELSGGEQQRVAIARALANDPNFILADEPTGNLDEANEKIVFQELKKLSNDGKTVIVVTHNDTVKKYADKIFYMLNGSLKEEK